VLKELFKTDERVKILRYICMRNTFSVQSVSKDNNLSKGLVSHYFSLLTHEHLLTRENRSFHRNCDPMWCAVTRVLNLDLLRKNVSLPPWAESIGIYGSWAEGTNNRESDLDLWVLVKNYTPDLEFEAGELQRELGAATGTEVHVLILTREKLQALKKKDIPFYTNFKNNHLTLSGDEIDKTG
jgi:predicted nucleotidyltransferase